MGCVLALNEEQTKQVVKEAIKEWMDEKFVLFGKWSLGVVGAAGIAALAYFIFWANGQLK